MDNFHSLRHQQEKHHSVQMCPRLVLAEDVFDRLLRQHNAMQIKREEKTDRPCLMLVIFSSHISGLAYP